jgi:hypothetical protein
MHVVRLSCIALFAVPLVGCPGGGEGEGEAGEGEGEAGEG